jgi:hypothetical protein
MIEQAIMQQIQVQEPFESSVKVMCVETRELLGSLKRKYGEEFSWVGDVKDNDAKFVLLINNKTKTWTLVTAVENGTISCMLGSGDKSTYVSPPTKSRL